MLYFTSRDETNPCFSVAKHEESDLALLGLIFADKTI